MIPEVGATCLFTFTPRFATLNGIYRIKAETTFRDALTSGVDFVKNLYVPAGLSQANFNTDQSGYMSDRVTILESVIDSSVVYYTPETIFATFPDPTINEYLKMILVVNLGVFQNTQTILPLLDQVKDLVQASVGTTDPMYVVSNPSNKVYLTDAQYTTLQNARNANIRALVPLSVQLAQEQAKNTFLAAKITAYEAMIAQLGGTPTP